MLSENILLMYFRFSMVCVLLMLYRFFPGVMKFSYFSLWLKYILFFSFGLMSPMFLSWKCMVMAACIMLVPMFRMLENREMTKVCCSMMM